jgi:excisionase family DNA binding protein
VTLDGALTAVVREAIAPVLAELRAARADLAEVRASLPPRMLSVREAAEAMGVSTQTIAAMAKRNEIASRRAGRRLLISAASLRPTDPARGAELAREARR